MKNILYIILTLPVLAIAQVGVDTDNPTEFLHINGTARINQLPLDGTTNAIATQPTNGQASLNTDGTLNKNQTFEASQTVVMDANGVVGSIAGKPLLDDGVKPLVYVATNAKIQDSTPGPDTPTASILTLGNISVRFNGTNPTGNEAPVSFRLNNATDNVIVNQIKLGSGSGSTYINGGQNDYRSAQQDNWYNITNQRPNVGNGDYVQYNIALLNTKEVYRLTVSVNPTENSLGIDGQVSLFLELLSNQ